MTLRSLGVVCAVMLAGFVSSARAETCQTDGDCGYGFTCVTQVYATCPCPPGGKCPVSCADSERRVCEPSVCTSDDECAENMVCNPEPARSACPVGVATTCPPGVPCEPPVVPIPECVDTVRYCTLRYRLPCQAAADCGPGFTCEEEELCSCRATPVKSGPSQITPTRRPLPAADGGTPAADASVPSPPPSPTQPPLPPSAADAGAPPDAGSAPVGDAAVPDCECHGSGRNVCKVIEVACQAASDCPESFACEAAARAPLSCAATPPAGVDASVAPCHAQEPVDPAKHCVPPDYNANPVTLPTAGSPAIAPVSSTVGLSIDAGVAPDSAGNSAAAEPTQNPVIDLSSEGCTIGQHGQGESADARGLGLCALLGCWLARRRHRRRRP